MYLYLEIIWGLFYFGLGIAVLCIGDTTTVSHLYGFRTHIAIPATMYVALRKSSIPYLLFILFWIFADVQSLVTYLRFSTLASGDPLNVAIMVLAIYQLTLGGVGFLILLNVTTARLVRLDFAVAKSNANHA
jgi:hypothetical protein